MCRIFLPGKMDIMVGLPSEVAQDKNEYVCIGGKMDFMETWN